MSNPVIFKSLPATFPEADENKKQAAVGSLVVHTVMVTAVLLIPLLMPQQIDRWQLMTFIAPLPPPPPPAPAVVQLETPVNPQPPQIQRIIQVEPGTVVMPTQIPKEIARIIDDAPATLLGGVTGGVAHGVTGGVLSGILSANVKTVEVAPPPPPPPPPPAPVATAPAAPIRVGGVVREPRVVKVVSPVYPALAKKARVQGTVVLDAVVTADGTVDEIKVVSGHPLLAPAAIDCVRQWKYEPTYLNGEPVAVILTAKIHFELGAL